MSTVLKSAAMVLVACFIQAAQKSDSRIFNRQNRVTHYSYVVSSTSKTDSANYTPCSSKAGEYRVRVCLVDYVTLPANTLEEIETSAKEIFRDAEISLDFVEWKGRNDCSPSFGGQQVVLRVLHPRFSANEQRLGYATMDQSGGGIATVYVDPRHKRERPESLSDGVRAGHAAAHEIGHLLLGAHSHCQQGIMRPHWGEKDEFYMAKGVLLFSKTQAAKMRAAIAQLETVAD